MGRKTVGQAEREIKALSVTDLDNFYDKVRNIVGYHEGVFWEDWDIKHLQRVADAKYGELQQAKLSFYND